MRNKEYGTLFSILYSLFSKSMSDNVLKHVIALFTTLVLAMAFIAGYGSGLRGWWWAAFALILVYGLIIKIIDN